MTECAFSSPAAASPECGYETLPGVLGPEHSTSETPTPLVAVASDPPATGSLPVTGAEMDVALFGVMILALGAMLLSTSRMRKRREAEN